MMTYKDLCGPDPNPMTLVEADTLRDIVWILPPDPVIVQIGAERGASTVAMLDKRPDAFIFSVDVGERPEERENLIRVGLDYKRVVRGLGRSQEIGLWWPPTWRADLVLIDGDHRRPGIDHDLGLWGPVVKAGGYLAIHDYIPPETRAPHIQGRVWEAVQEWESRDGRLFVEVVCTDRLMVYRRQSI